MKFSLNLIPQDGFLEHKLHRIFFPAQGKWTVHSFTTSAHLWLQGAVEYGVIAYRPSEMLVQGSPEHEQHWEPLYTTTATSKRFSRPLGQHLFQDFPHASLSSAVQRLWEFLYLSLLKSLQENLLPVPGNLNFSQKMALLLQPPWAKRAKLSWRVAMPNISSMVIVILFSSWGSFIHRVRLNTSSIWVFVFSLFPLKRI